MAVYVIVLRGCSGEVKRPRRQRCVSCLTRLVWSFVVPSSRSSSASRCPIQICPAGRLVFGGPRQLVASRGARGDTRRRQHVGALRAEGRGEGVSGERKPGAWLAEVNEVI